MTFLYDTWYPVVLLRPKNEVKILTQSAAKWICMGKWAFKILAELFLKNDKSSDNRSFPPNADGSLVLGKLTPVQNGPGDGGKKTKN